MLRLIVTTGKGNRRILSSFRNHQNLMTRHASAFRYDPFFSSRCLFNTANSNSSMRRMLLLMLFHDFV